MSTSRPADATAVTAAVRALERAGFVRVLARADADALAASGVLTRALADREIPFQVSVASTVGERTARLERPNRDEVTLVVGVTDTDEDDGVYALESDDRPASLLAWDVATDLVESPGDSTLALALAGAFAAGGDLESDADEDETAGALESALDRGLVARRAGLAVPTDDLADGLAHTTLCRAPWSGDLEATRSMVAEFDVDGSASTDDASSEPDGSDGVDHRPIASCVALDVVGDEAATTRAAHAVARVLRPYAVCPTGSEDDSEALGHPFTTIGGYADVLEAAARDAPGLGIALAVNSNASSIPDAAEGIESTASARALAVWREHGRRAHDALDDASTSRYDGLFVVEIDDGPVETVARLAADYRSPEPLVLAIGDGEAAVATTDIDGRPLEGLVESIASSLEVGGAYDVGRRRGYVRLDGADVDEIVTTVRELL